MLGADRLLVGSDFPAMPREQPAGRTLRSIGLPDSVLDDITWNNCFRFLGTGVPDAPDARAGSGAVPP
jgi:aminocarboxymuconate-semialdehyde decarboxylase